MKNNKIFIALAAGILTFFGCQPLEKATVNLGQSTPPVLGATTVTSESISAKFDPATIYVGDQPVKPELVRYSLAIVKVGEDVVSYAIDSDDSAEGVVSADAGAVSTALVSIGYPYGETVDLTLTVRARLSTTAQNGFVDSEGTFAVPGFKIKKANPASSGSKYPGFADTSTWGITGSIASTGNNWGNSDDPDIKMYTNGTWCVAEAVELTTSDEFKFRENSAWTNNMGGAFAELGVKFDLEANGANIKILADGTYDIFFNPTDAKALIVATPANPYAAFTEPSTWGVTGSIASTGNNWGNSDDPDIVMKSDGTWHMAMKVALTPADEFKFRENSAWTNNLGGTFVALDAEFDVEANGSNIKVLEDGTYDLLVDPVANKAKIQKSVEFTLPAGL